MHEELTKKREELKKAQEYLERQELFIQGMLLRMNGEYLWNNFVAGKAAVVAAQEALDEELRSYELATCGNCGEEKLVTEGFFPDFKRPHDFICNGCAESDE